VVALVFVSLTLLNHAALIGKGLTPASDVIIGSWFTLTTVHALHVLAGAMTTAWLAGPPQRIATVDPHRWLSRIEVVRRYWWFVDAVWVAIVLGFYVI
jgi:cytochrome c oxidase subunit 3